MVAPFHADGSINPPGVRDRIPETFDRSRLIDDYENKSGWNCKKCNAWINCPPRAAVGPEPATWWWCNGCKNKYGIVENKNVRRGVKNNVNSTPKTSSLAAFGFVSTQNT